jgi:hypothetical protein
MSQGPPDFDESLWEPMTPEPTEKELAEAEASNEHYSLEEVLAHLRSLE